jgi:hypothetical protein
MLDPLPRYDELGSGAFDYTFDCPVGTWRARLDMKAWGKGRNILLYFTETATGRKYCICVFDASYYTPEDRGFDFRRAGEPGDIFELKTAKTRTGRTRFLSAKHVAAPEEWAPEENSL